MKIIYIILILVGITSCVKENPEPKPVKPIIITPIYNDTTIGQSVKPLVGQRWVITGIRIGGIGNPNKINDTLDFKTTTGYVYNGYTSKYSLFSNGMTINLTLYETPWGMLDGTIYPMNLNQGKIEGLPFTDISYGSSNNTKYYIWMNKI